MSVKWVSFFEKKDVKAVHWSTVGRHDDPDDALFEWAARHAFTILSQDKDFGTLLFRQGLTGPSLIRIKSGLNRVTPERCGDFIWNCIARFSEDVENGAVLTIDIQNADAKIRMLSPLPEMKH